MTLEQFIDAVITHLKADLPTRILAANATYSDGRNIVMGIPNDAHFSTGTDPLLGYPFIEVAAPDFFMDEFSLGQYDSRMEIDVVVRAWISEPQPPIERADRHIKRFGSVLVDSLQQPNAFGQGETISRLRGAYRVNPENEKKEGPFAAVTLVYTIGSVGVRP